MDDADIKDRSPRARVAYRVDDLTIDVGTAQVHRDGRPVPMPRLSFDLLLALVEAAPNLVTVDELMARVWPGLVVNAETVSQRVKLLRVAIDDDPRHPRYVAVSRGRGYRLIPAVVTLDAATAPAASPSPATAADAAPAPPRVAPWRARRAWLWSAAVVLALALAALYVNRRHAASPSAAPRPTAAEGAAADAAAARAELPERSVAVLPFDNLGRSPQDAALAFGVAESLLHRLSASRELTVIARQSSFSVAPRGADVREIGRRLNARFLVEGSLQSTADRLRITAQLIDATTGSHVWSLQFDRKSADIFVIQDEIAANVADALRVAVMAPHVARSSGTRDFDAYLAYAQGRAYLATGRVADARLAVREFERAMQIDPRFARAYAGLAEATLWVADGEMSRERTDNLRKARQAGRTLLERALAIDSSDADTHLQLASLDWDDGRGDRAEQQLMRALELNPNSAAGYRQLALFRLFHDRRPDDALAAIDRARLLSPLETQYDNDKAMLALYGKFDVRLAEQLSLGVLERDPTSAVALRRLGELYWCCRGEAARGVKYLEQALQRDPDHEFGRRILMRAYLDLDDADEARAIALGAPHPVDMRLVPALVYRGEWRAAADRIYDEDALGTAQAIEADLRVLALRMHARETGDYERARRYLEERAGVTWDAGGAPVLDGAWMPDYAVGLGDVLMQMGDAARGRRVLEAALRSIDDESRVRGRGDGWYLSALAATYALLGRDEEALSTLERCVAERKDAAILLFLEREPAYRRFRALPRFQKMTDAMRAHRQAERLQLDRMRAAGLVPHRSGK